MSPQWPPLDCHAHIDPTIPAEDAVALRAVVFAATRSIADYRRTLSRADPVTVWGVGVHPGVPAAVAEFSVADFREAMLTSPLVCEVGLDAKSDVPLSQQIPVFEAILDAIATTPRIASVHSVGATSAVLDAIESRPVRGAILHWWRGSPAETARAVDLGCWFSVNAAEIGRSTVIGHVPNDRILAETDFPFGAAVRPGDVEAVESFLRPADPAGARERLWQNLASLVDETATLELFSPRIRGVIQTAARRPRDSR